MNLAIEKEKRFSAHMYHPLEVVLVRGERVWVWDDAGNPYFDFLSAYSALNYGHCHPRLIKVLYQQAQRLPLSSRVFYNDQMGPFLEKLCHLCGLDMAVPMNSGAEAVETALKAARLWGSLVKKIQNPEIIVVSDNFHGRTLSIISFSSHEEYRRGFGPFTPGFKIIPFGDAKALENAITPSTCAFLIEPIQGEAGVKIPPPGYLKAVESICHKHRILFLVDEIQSGLGRAGKLFAFQYEAVKPDGIILGKALGGGLLPLSAFVAKKEILSLFTPGSHGSTFGGNPLACAVGSEALDVLQEEDLVEKSKTLGQYFYERVQAMKSPLIQEIRWRGLWIGLDIDSSRISARKFCEQLMQKGLLAKDTHETTIRLAPPLIITKQELDKALEILESVLKKVSML